MALVQNASVGYCPRQTDKKEIHKEGICSYRNAYTDIPVLRACVCVCFRLLNYSFREYYDGVGLQSELKLQRTLKIKILQIDQLDFQQVLSANTRHIQKIVRSGIISFYP